MSARFPLFVCLVLSGFIAIAACTRAGEVEQQGGAGAPAASRAAVGMQSIGPEQAITLIRGRKDLVVVDVRTEGELAGGVIEGSLTVPFWAMMRGEHGLPRDKAVLLVCAVGGRSYAAGQVLVRSGYPEVYNLSGGISAWQRAGLPLK